MYFLILSSRLQHRTFWFICVNLRILLFLQRCIWDIPSSVIRCCITGRLMSEFWKNGVAFRNSGLNYRMKQRRIPKERNSGLNCTVTQLRIPKERNSGLNYRATQRPIPKERNSGLNYTLKQQPPLHTENGGKKVPQNISTYQSSRRHIIKDNNYNDPCCENVTFVRIGASKRFLNVHYELVSSNS